MSFNIAQYWNKRYSQGRDSGEGSRGQNAVSKAQKVNLTIDRYDVKSLIDWGCGDGRVLGLIRRDVPYVGVDVSSIVLNKVQAENPGRFFVLYEKGSRATHWLRVDMSLSMDVLFHLVNDDDYLDYLDNLFGSARKVVLIYSTNYNGGRTAPHVLRRQFSVDVKVRYPGWRLVDFTEQEDPTQPGFYTYLRSTE